MFRTETTRRILTFPAVHPADNISPSTLISSLTTLATKICSFKTQTFTSNRRNARESIRLVAILLEALLELNDAKSDLPYSVLLSLSEIHLAFQKLAYLLEDCVADGCRLLILMKSEIVASYFHVFMRSVSTALDVLMPLNFVSDEVKESVELMMIQARRLRFEVDEADVVVVQKVNSILDRFGGKIVDFNLNAFRFRTDFSLDVLDLKFVIEYLGIRNWSDCDLQIKFLCKEIEYSESVDEFLISGLIGLMTYARVLVFDCVEEQVKVNVNVKSVLQAEVVNQLSCINADDFRCPISLEFMSDPVTVATGQTYDRSSISTWLKNGNSTCPKTGEILRSTDLVPNYALKKLIRQYCAENGILVSEPAKVELKKAVVVECAAAEGAVKRASSYLVSKLSCGRSSERNKAAYEIRLMAKASVFNRSCLAEAGAIPHLLDLLASSDPVTQENAIAAVLNLSKHPRSKSIIMEYGGLSLLIDVLKTGMKTEAKQHAAGVLFYLCSVDEYRKIIGETPDTIPGLVDMVRDGHKRGKKNALIAIFGLLMHQDNRWRVLKAGLVPLLLDLLKSSDSDDLSSDCLPVLSILSETPDGSFSILRRGGLRLCTQVLVSSCSNTATEFCVSTLINLCLNGGRDMVSILANDQSLIKALYSILADGTSRASRKASSLLHTVHEFHEANPSSGRRPGVGSTTAMSREHYYVHAW